MNFDWEKLLENIFDGLYVTDKHRKITYWNKSAEKITGFSAKEVVGKVCADNILIHVDEIGHSLCKGICPLGKTINDGSVREAEVYLHHKDGHRVPVLVRTMQIKNDNGSVIGGAELFTDISSKRASDMKLKELEKLALLDKLTGLSNRHHMEAELRARFQELKRYSLSFGILFFDLDHFKSVNDTYGHETGDTVLKTTAQTLISIARPFDVFGRWGGEEFIGIIRNVDKEELHKVAERCRVLISKSQIPCGKNSLSVTASVGATIVKKNDTIESAIQRVDQLMYQSKKKGRNRLSIG